MSIHIRITSIILFLSTQIYCQNNFDTKSAILDSLFTIQKYGEFIKEVDRMTNQEKEHFDYPFIQQSKGLANFRIGKYRKSIEEYKIAIALLNDGNYATADVLDVYHYLSNTYMYLNLDTCLYYKDFMIEEARFCPEETTMQLARALEGKAQVLIYLEEYGKSKEYLDEAEKIFLSSEDESAEGSLSILYGTKGYMYRKYGDLKKALLYNQKALTIRTKLYGENSIMVAGNYNNLAAAYSHLRNYDKGIYNYKKSLEITKSQPIVNHLWEYRTLSNIGSSLFKNKKYEEALCYLDEAINIGEKIFSQNRAKLLYNYYLIGDCFRVLNDEKYALKYYNLSIKCAEESNNKYIDGLSDPLIRLGELALLDENYKQAILNLQKALNLFPLNQNGLPSKENISSTSNVYAIYAKLAQVYLKKFKETNDANDLNFCETYHLNAEYIFNQLVADIHDPKSKQIIYEKSMITYELGIEISYLKHQHSNTTNEVEKALKYIENSRNLELNSWLHMDVFLSDDQLYASISDSKKIIKKINSLEFKVKNRNFPASQSDSIFYFNEKLDSIHNFIEENYGKQFYNNLTTKDFRIADLQSRLKSSDSKDILLNYFQGHKSSFLIAVWKDGYSFEKLDPKLFDFINLNETSILGKQITASDENLESGNQFVLRNKKGFEFRLNNDFIPEYKKLYDLLLKPRLKKGNFEKLIIIPDKNLSLLSFEAFLQTNKIPSDSTTSVNYRTLPYVIADYDVVYEYSLSTFQNSKDEIIVKNNEYVGYSPFSSHTDSSSFQQLPYSKTEISAGSKLLDGKILSASAANRHSFITKGLNQKIVHLATHGVTNDEGSFIYFNPDSEHESVLSLEEIYSLDINTEVLLLSACDSGKGAIQEGEGIINFGRVFFSNGCKSVIESLWQVNDHSSSTIIQNLFKNLESNNDLASSLSEAKRQYITQTDNQILTHPFFWAPLVQRGDVTITIEKTNNIFPLMLCLTLLILTVLFAFNNKATE